MAEFRIRVNFAENFGENLLDEINDFVESLRSRPKSVSAVMNTSDVNMASGYVLVITEDATDAISILLNIADAYVEAG